MKTFSVLKSLPCDLFLGAHGAYFGLIAKYEKMKAGGPNPFIDPDGYRAYVSEREDAFRKEWERQKQNPGAPAPRRFAKSTRMPQRWRRNNGYLILEY